MRYINFLFDLWWHPISNWAVRELYSVIDRRNLYCFVNCSILMFSSKVLTSNSTIVNDRPQSSILGRGSSFRLSYDKVILTILNFVLLICMQNPVDDRNIIELRRMDRRQLQQH